MWKSAHLRLPDADFQRLVREARTRHNLSDIIGRHTTLKKRGKELAGLCCFHSERSPSLEVNDAKGTYHCHGCGAGGDAITFLTTHEGMRFIEAVQWLLGDDLPVIPEEERAKRKARAQEDLQARIDDARSIWERAVPAAGTPAEVYARSRGITMPLPDTIRFVQTPRWRHADTGECGRDVPAMTCALQDRQGSVVGVQCVFLEAGGERKYQRQRPDGQPAKAKLSFGMVAGSALRLGPPSERVILCEGPEDGLSILQQAPEQTVWVACGTAFLPRVDFPPVVAEVVLAGDNGEAGRKAVEEASAAYTARGLAVSDIFPEPQFADWNDELRGISR